MTRSVSTDRLINKVRRACGDLLSEAAEKAIRDYLRRQPKAPEMVSRGGAAKILGKRTAHLDRIEDMPEAIEIEGGWPVYLKSEIEALKEKIDAEKEEPVAAGG